MTTWITLASTGLLLVPLAIGSTQGSVAACTDGSTSRQAPAPAARDSVVLEGLEVEVFGRPVGLEVEGYEERSAVGDTLGLTYWPTSPGGARTPGLVSWRVDGCGDAIQVRETSDTSATVVLLRPGHYVLVAEVHPVDFMRIGAIGVTGPEVPPGEFVWDSWEMMGDPDAYFEEDGTPVSGGEVVRVCAFAFQEGDPPRLVGASSRECRDAAFPDSELQDVVRPRAVRALLARVVAAED